MSELLILKDSVPFVSHIVVAQNTQNKENSIRDLITKYYSDFEEFGKVRFTLIQNEKGGKPKKVYELNEEQYSLLMTYIKNNETARTFKKNIVKAFFTLKKKHDLSVQNGYKSQLAQRNKKIEELENKLKSIPSFSKNKKIDILISKIDDVMKKEGFSFYQPALKFVTEYNKALQTGGEALEKFAVEQINEARAKAREAQQNEFETRNKYNNMIDRIKSFIEASNSISLLNQKI